MSNATVPVAPNEVAQCRCADNPTLRSRFYVTHKIPEFQGHRGVTLVFFHARGLPDDLYREILAPLDPETPYLASAADETFSAEEVKALRAACAKAAPEGQFSAEPCGPIPENCIGVGAIPVGGNNDFLMLDKSDSFCPFPVRAHFDLRFADAGPWVEHQKQLPSVEPGATK
jgi:hypothetical protein